jgi:hypothetical protein
MDDDFLESARREEARLVRRLAAVRALIADYRGVAGNPRSGDDISSQAPPRTRTPRPESMASQTLRIAEQFLERIGRRAQSGEIYGEMKRHGVEIQGNSPESVVSSYLSNSNKFNNVRGRGYGLSVWEGHENRTAAPTDEGAAV